MSERRADLMQTFGVGLGTGYIVGAYDRVKPVWQKAIQRYVGFTSETAREDREVMALGKAIEEVIFRQPLFAQDQAIGIVAEEEFLKIIDDLLVRSIASVFLNQARRELPVVIPSAAILPVLNLFGRGFVAREIFDRRFDGGAVRFVDIDQHAVHIENEKIFHQI